MKQYIDKAALVAEIEKLIDKGKYCEEYYCAFRDGNNNALYELKLRIDTLEVKEEETPVIPKYSYFEEIYHCGSEPRWKIGDVLAVYEFYSDYEGEYIYGKITDVKMDETEDWCYTFENGDMVYENRLISDETYKKN